MMEVIKGCRSCRNAGLEKVLELGELPLANSLILAEDLDKPELKFSLTLAELADMVVAAWGEGKWEAVAEGNAPHEAAFLGLSCNQAGKLLEWEPGYGIEQAVKATVQWRQKAPAAEDMSIITFEQIENFMARARDAGLVWAAG